MNNKVKVTLAEAKIMLGNEQVYQNGNRFSVSAFGKYQPNVTFDIPTEWESDGKEAVSPCHFIKAANVIRSLNLHFAARINDSGFMFCKARKSQAGKWVITPTTPEEAPYIMVRLFWGGAFDHSRGYEGGDQMVYERRASSNGHGAGIDYILFEKEKYIDLDAATSAHQDFHKGLIESYIAHDKHVKTIKAYKDECIKELSKIFDEVKAIRPETPPLELGELSYKGFGYYVPQDYSPRAIEEAECFLANVKKHYAFKSLKAELEAKYAPMLAEAGIQLNATVDGIEIERKCFSTKVEVIQAITEAYNTYQAKKAEEAAAEVEAIRAAEYAVWYANEVAKATKLGIPSNFDAYNRLYGGAGLRSAFVITPNGEQRKWDAFKWANPNHRYKYYQEEADGYRHWNQILPGEIAFTWEKNNSKCDVHFEFFYIPEQITQEQAEAVDKIVADLEERFPGQVEEFWAE